MEKVTGIGGLFFRAKDPKALAQWYSEHLGVAPVPSSEGDETWEQQAGPCVFAPFKESTTYFGEGGKAWMVNFRVSDMAAMASQLRAAGITVEIAEDESMGKFARLYDPEGTPIELWEPL